MFVLLSTIAFPLILAIGGLLTWRKIRSERLTLPSSPVVPRDEAFDEWRRERDEARERDRAERSANPPAPGDAGQGEESTETRTNRQITGG